MPRHDCHLRRQWQVLCEVHVLSYARELLKKHSDYNAYAAWARLNKISRIDSLLASQSCHLIGSNLLPLKCARGDMEHRVSNKEG
jgi:hypothetical protein